MNYPPTHDQAMRLFEELKSLDAETGSVFNSRKYEIIHDLAEANFFEAKPYLAAGMKNPDPDYRWECISALVTHWGLTDPQIISGLLELAATDPDVQVRYIAIASLGQLKVKQSLPLLKLIAKDSSSDPLLTETAYISLLEILDYPEEQIRALRGHFDPDAIDQRILDSA
jgi:HEAT repeat protein